MCKKERQQDTTYRVRKRAIGIEYEHKVKNEADIISYQYHIDNNTHPAKKITKTQL